MIKNLIVQGRTLCKIKNLIVQGKTLCTIKNLIVQGKTLCWELGARSWELGAAAGRWHLVQRWENGNSGNFGCGGRMEMMHLGE